MSNKPELFIGDEIYIPSEDEEYLVKYVWNNGLFLTETNEIKSITEDIEIKRRNDSLVPLKKFDQIEQDLLIMFYGGEKTLKVFGSLSDKYEEHILEFHFKKLIREGYLMNLFGSKYISKIREKNVLKIG